MDRIKWREGDMTNSERAIRCNAGTLQGPRAKSVSKAGITATVIECPGRWEDEVFKAVQIDVQGVRTPFVMTMALPKVCYRALAQFVNPGDLYQAIADAINTAQPSVQVNHAPGVHSVAR